MSNEATPTPWRANEHGDIFSPANKIVCATFDIRSDENYEEQQANAALIVRAVNNHEKLVKALKLISHISNGKADEAFLLKHGTPAEIAERTLREITE